MEDNRNAYGISVGKTEEVSIEDLGVDGSVILKYLLKK
jgi:predicted RNA-binding protein with TRAM domain